MRALAALALLVLAGCGDDGPANVAGMYTLNLTAGANGCNIDNWTVGETTSGVVVTLDQTSGSAEVSGVIQAAAGFVIAVLFKTNMFSGRVSGNDIDVLLTSLYDPTVMGNCSFKYQLHLTGELSADILTGTLDITTSTNGGSDCGALQNCHSVETFNGSRPPSGS